MRAVRYAVAAAYIFVFASDPHGETPDPKPKLVELAIRGAGLPDENGASGSPQGSQGPGHTGGSRSRRCTPPSRKQSDETDGGAIRKIRLYVDHVSAPFAADLESTKWTDDAVHELQQTIVTSQQQLSDL